MTPPSRNDRSRRRPNGPRRELTTLDLKATDLTPTPDPVTTDESSTASLGGVSGGTQQPPVPASADEGAARAATENTSVAEAPSASGAVEPDPARAGEIAAQDSAGGSESSAAGLTTQAADRAVVEENSAGELPSASPPPLGAAEESSSGAADGAKARSPSVVPEGRAEASQEAGPSVTPRLAAAERGALADTPSPEPRREARRGLGFGALLGAGLLGGVVGAGGTIATQPWWGNRASGEISGRLAQIEERVNAAAPRDAFGALERRVGTLEASQAALAGDVRAVRTLAEQGAARAEEALNRPAPAGPAPAEGAPAASLAPPSEERLTALETELRDLKDAVAADQAQDGRLAALEADLQRLREAPPPNPAQDVRLSDLQAAVTNLRQSVEAAQQASQSRFAALELEQRAQRDAATAALDRRIAEQGQRVATLAQQVTGQDARLAALAKEVAERAAGPLAASLRVILADRVGAALREGTPYADALGTLRRLRADPAQLSALEPFAASGAPSAAALAQEFRPLAEQIETASRSEADDWTDRLKRMASQIVTVRAVGESDASSVSGLLARIDGALARGALRDAAEAWDALPEPARQASAEWAQKLKGRLAAEEAARRLSTEALSALEASTR